MEKQGSSNFKIIAIALGALLAGSIGYNFMSSNDFDEKKEYLLEEKKEIAVELDSMLNKYDDLLSENTVMNDSLLTEKQKVTSLLKKLKNTEVKNLSQLRGYKSELNVLKQENTRLTAVANSLRKQNMLLATENDSIKVENVTIKDSLVQEKDFNKYLATENKQLAEKIQTGKALKASGIVTEALVVKNSGRTVVTERARRTERIRTCFTINENSLVANSEKEISLQVKNPSGAILGDQKVINGITTSAGKIVQISNSKNVDVCLFVDLKNDAEKGTYNITIFAGDKVLGQSQVTLR